MYVCIHVQYIHIYSTYIIIYCINSYVEIYIRGHSQREHKKTKNDFDVIDFEKKKLKFYISVLYITIKHSYLFSGSKRILFSFRVDISFFPRPYSAY